MKHLSFRQRQLLIMLALAVAPLALAAIIGLSNTRNAIMERTTAQLETVAELKTVQVQHWLDAGRDLARLFASGHEVSEYLPTLLASPDAEAVALAVADLSTEMSAYSSVFSHVKSVSLLHPTSGQVMLSTDPAQEGRERRDEGYFREGQQALSVNLVAYSVGREAPVLIFSAPVRDDSGELLAVVAVEMNLADLEATLSSRAGLRQTGRAYLVESHAFYVTLPPDLEGSPLCTIAESEGVTRVLDGQNGSGTYLDPRGISVLGVYRWLPEGNLGLLVEIEEAEIIGQFRRTATMIVLMNLGVLALAVVVARNLANWLVAPLERIAGAARALQAGDLGHRAPSGGPDEIGQLATAFNEMAASLQNYYENLEQLVEQRTAELTAANEELEQEVAARKRAEDDLRESEEKYRILVENANEAILVGQDEMLKFANLKATEITGYSREELTSRLFVEFIHPDDRGMVARRYQARLKGEELPSVYYFRTIDKEGNIKWLEISAVLITWEGRPATLNFLSDITDRKRAEEELKEYSERLEEMVDERTKELRDAQEQLIRREKLAIMGQMAGGVAHELRNPLATISNAAYYLKTVLSDADETVKEYLEMIAQMVRDSNRIITDLLDFSRTRIPDREKVAVSELVAEVLEKRPPPENVEVTTQFAPDLPPVYIDRHQMGQVLGNLVTNAYQSMTSSSSVETPEEGRLTICAQAEEGAVSLSIVDTGGGISEEDKARLFEPLFTTKIKGLGLGLMVVKSLVEANGGSIEVTSEVGKGSTFTVRLPHA